MSKEADQKLFENAQYVEYTKGVNPLAKGAIPPVALGNFLHTLHESGSTRVIPFDLSAQLSAPGPATSPTLCANFIRIEADEKIVTCVNASSQMYYVIRGKGTSQTGQFKIAWQAGDFMALAGGEKVTHEAESESAIYWVHDEPLLTYLGAKAAASNLQPTVFKGEVARQKLAEINEDPHSTDRNRISVILADKRYSQTISMTQTLWTMLGILPANSVQPPHRHNSVALDLILDCPTGCYTLLAKSIDRDGKLLNPIRADWMPYSAFVTPPWLWHAHYNPSDKPAHFVPVQDAGLHSYLRTLDIEFFHDLKSGRTAEDLAKELV